MPDNKAEAEKMEQGELHGPSNLQDAVSNLLDQVGKSSSSIATVAARELAIAVSVANDIRDTALNEEVLVESRDIDLIRNVRKTAHSVVDLGFDLAALSARTVDRSLRMFLSADRQR